MERVTALEGRKKEGVAALYAESALEVDSHGPVIVAGAALPDGSSIWRISASPDVESIGLEGESSATRFDSRTVGRWIARPDLTPPVVESITRR